MTTRSFVLLFERCRNDTFSGVCKSDEEITVWLRRKFVVVVWNQIRFSTRVFNGTKINHESRFIYVPVNSQVREEIVHKVYLTDLRLQDEEYIQIGDYTEDNIVTFNHKHTANRPYEFPDNIHL